MSTRIKISVGLVFLIGLCQFSCREEIEIEPEGNIVSIIDNADQELIEVRSHPAGGFVVGIVSWRGGNQNIRVQKYDSDLNLEWERWLGGKGKETLQRMFVSVDGDIFLAGLGHFGQDDTLLRVSKIDRPYCHLLSADGVTIFEKELSISYQDYTGRGQLFVDITQTPNGSFWLSGRLGIEYDGQPGLAFIGPYGAILEVMPDGESERIYYTRAYSMESVFYDKNVDRLITFYTEHLRDGLAGFYEFKRYGAFGADLFTRVESTPWIWNSSSFANGSLSRIKLIHESGELSHNVVFPDQIFQFKYDPVSKSIKTAGKDLTFRVHAASPVGDTACLISTPEGKFFELNTDFEVKMESNPGWTADHLCKMTNGEYVLVGQFNNNINILHLDQNGNFKRED